ncbi:MAG TPA: ATPase domain-containing protein [Steroidobacteraceae bacterium]|nr:ATPase domain-containing protein [Steroidobacteraceae bacterium]
MLVKGVSRSKIGVAGLDEILHGGLIPARLYLIDGNPGAGKTTLALHFLQEGVRAGECSLYITLSETAEELRAGAHSHGWSLSGIEIVELIADEGEFGGENQLTMFHPSEVDLTETTRKVLEAIERINPRRLVFDSLSELRLLAQSSLRYRRQILAFKQFMVGRDCTVLMLDDRTSEVADLQLQSIAHGVISLDYKSPTYGRARREIQILKFRGSDFSSGFHDFVVRKGGLTVFPRLAAGEHTDSIGRQFIESRVTDLDTLLGGGIERGTSTLLVGPPGSGKSSIALQYTIAAAAGGDHGAIFAFEETISAMMVRSRGLGLMINEGIGAGQIQVQQIDPAEISPGQFAYMVRESVEKNNARVVVIDSLNGYLNAMPADRFLTAQLHELLAYLSNRGVATFIVVAQNGMMGSSMQSPVDASYLADSVVMLRFFEHAGKVKKAISVLKKRTGAHEESIRELSFDSRGIHLSKPLLQLRGVLTGVPVEVQSAGRSANGGARG